MDTDVIALCVAGAGGFISLSALAYSRLQAIAAQKQVTYAEQQAAAAQQQVVAAQQQVIAAQQQVEAANRQVEVARQDLELAEMARREALEPQVVVDIRSRAPGSELLWFVIENIGQTHAFNVRISVSPPLRSSLGANTEEKLNDAIARPIRTLGPRQRIGFTMDVGHALFSDETLPRVYEVTVEADSYGRSLDPVTYEIDLAALRYSALDRDSLHWSVKRIADEAEKSGRIMERQLRAIHRLACGEDGASPSTPE
jgi:hypothetical protein